MAKATNLVEIAMGARLRSLRLRVGLSQEDIAYQLGVSFQQVQKYETGANRISPSRLVQLAHLFQVPVGALFCEDDAEDKGGEHRLDQVTDRRALRLLRAYDALTDRRLRQAIVDLAEGLVRETRSRNDE